MKKVTVLGCGRWASFLAWYAHKQNHAVTMWGRPGSARLEQLRQTHRNEYIELSSDIKLTDDLASALQSADFIIISISTQSLRSLLQQMEALHAIHPDQTFILCMKGLEQASGKRLTQIFQEEMTTDNVAIWAGPGHIQSFYAGIPNCMVIDANSPLRQEKIISAFGSDLVRFYYGTDLIGNEIGAATKNVIGIAAGMLDGLDLTALKGALMARAPQEISRLIVTLGGNSMTSYGLAHLGDYEATLFSPHSNNRLYGENFTRHIPSTKLAEGVPTLQAVHHLQETHDLDLPICNCLYQILFEQQDAKKGLDALFSRPLKSEFSREI